MIDISKAIDRMESAKLTPTQVERLDAIVRRHREQDAAERRRLALVAEREAITQRIHAALREVTTEHAEGDPT